MNKIKEKKKWKEANPISYVTGKKNNIFTSVGELGAETFYMDPEPVKKL